MGSRGTNGLERNRGAVGSMALGLGALVAVACVSSGPEGGWKPAPYAPPPPPEADDEGFGDDDEDSFDDPSAATATPSASAPAAELRADGAGCATGSECQSGICEGQGCEPDKGKCAPKERECTGAKQQLCDCAGKTITVEKASCPGVTFKYPGPCK